MDQKLKETNDIFAEIACYITNNKNAKHINKLEDIINENINQFTNYRNIAMESGIHLYFHYLCNFIDNTSLIVFYDNGNETNIFKAIEKGDLNCVKFLIDNHFVDINEKNEEGLSPLYMALKCKQYDIHDYLLYQNPEFYFAPVIEKPVDFEPDLYKACNNGKLSSVQYLMQKDPSLALKKIKDAYYPNDLAIHVAARAGHLFIVEFLIEKMKVDVDILGYKSFTPLLCATQSGYLDITQYLISKGANIQARDHWNLRTPLHNAARYQHTDIVKYLISKGARKNAIDYYDSTPADHTDKEEILNLLR